MRCLLLAFLVGCQSAPPQHPDARISENDEYAARFRHAMQRDREFDAARRAREEACRRGDQEICEALERERCDAACQAHSQVLAALPRVFDTSEKPLGHLTLEGTATVIRFEYVAGFRGNRLYEVQRAGTRTLLLDLCPEFECVPASREVGEACWSRIANALEAAHFWDANALVPEDVDRTRRRVLDNPRITIEAGRGADRRRFEFHQRVDEKRYPGDALADELWVTFTQGCSG